MPNIVNKYANYSRYIGKEPSGSEGEALALKNGKPHNPLIMTGGLAVSSLIKPTLCFSERFEYFQNKVQRYNTQKSVAILLSVNIQ